AFLAAAPLFPVVHFAGHALRNDANPVLSSLLFTSALGPGESGVLYAHDLLGLRFSRTRLVALSGCDPSSGAPSTSEGATGLAAALLAAGVPAVLGSLWRAEDTGSQALFTLFYRRLAAGASPALAWRAAVVE